MEIRIKTLRLRNFKGVRDAEYTFGGRNARIEGLNGSGKSTVFDAFTWLLFGKDHRDQTENTFEIKTIDPATGEPYPHLEHWVEAELLVDGTVNVLRRCWDENWITPTGQVEPVLKGHTNSFFVNGVDVGTKRAYDAAVAAWMKEDAFRLLTNPLYFIGGTDWKVRRKALLDLVKDSPERARVREEFADVVDKLSGRSLDDVRRQLKAEIAANKTDLARCLSNIDGMRQALPEQVDNYETAGRLSELQAERDGQLEDIKDAIAGIDTAITDYNAANAGRKARVDAIWAEITQVQLRAGEDTAREQKAAQEENNRAKTAALQAYTDVAGMDARIKSSVTLIAREEQDLEDLLKQRGQAAAELSALGDEYRREKAKAFEYSPETRCPYCGQELPAATREEAEAKAREHYMAERKAVLEGIVKKAEQIKASVKRLDETIGRSRGMIDDHRARLEEVRTEREARLAEYNRLKAVPMKDLDAITEKYRIETDRKVQDLRLQAGREGANDDTLHGLTQRRKDLEKEAERIRTEYAAKERTLNDRLAVNKERVRQLALIARKEQEAANFADAIARDQRAEARLAEFVEADIRSVEGAIGSLFRVARWKMFSRTIDGGLVEMCEVTDRDGTPYRSMNDAMKAICGMDVIRVFSERFSAIAPIFIDNAEGILQERFDTQAQVIRLVVKDCPITLINE